MKFKEFDDYIEVFELSDFNVKQTLECGQIFRYKVQDFGYTVYSLNHKADIYCHEDSVKIYTKDKKYFIKYFDFYTNYDKIKSSLGVEPILKSSIDYGYGIRILNSDPLEMLISFIISQNNNIPRIRAIIEKICEAYGDNMGDYFAFPRLEQLKKIPLKFFTDIKCGYRDKYLFDTISRIGDEIDIEKIKDLNTADARRELCKFKGVGRKVADCVLLFGYHKTDVFPTDTWIIQAYNKIYNKECTNAVAISDYFLKKFGDLAGFAQQYLFYQMRESSLGEKLWKKERLHYLLT